MSNPRLLLGRRTLPPRERPLRALAARERPLRALAARERPLLGHQPNTPRRLGNALLLLALLTLFTGCAVKAALVWDDLPTYTAADVTSSKPEGRTTVAIRGEPAPSDGLIVEAAYLHWLETVVYEVYPDTVDTITLLQSGRAEDRAYASETYADAVGRLRSRMDGVCALCAGLGAGASAGVGAAVCGGAP